MRSLWLLPDVKQTGYIQVLESNILKPLSESLDVKNIPRFITLGVPEELVRDRHNLNEFIYGQFYRGKGFEDSIFVCSCPSERDISGRVTFITNLQVINCNERVIFPPSNNTSRTEAMKLIGDFIKVAANKKFTENIDLMLEAVEKNPNIDSFVSEHLRHALNQPQWMPVKKKNSLLINCFILLILVMVLISVSKLIVR